MCIRETLVYEKDSGPLFCELKATSLGLPSRSEGRVCGASAESCCTYRQCVDGHWLRVSKTQKTLVDTRIFSFFPSLTCSGDQT